MVTVADAGAVRRIMLATCDAASAAAGRPYRYAKIGIGKRPAAGLMAPLPRLGGLLLAEGEQSG